jgi:hypothetical protein
LRKVKLFTLRLSIILVFIFVLSSCQSTPHIIEGYKENPCLEAQYLKLKKMKITEMTGIESEYFKEKEKECREFTEKVKAEKSYNDFLIVLVVGVIITAVIVFLSSFKMH